MKEIVLDAKVDNLPQLLSIIDEELENAGCSMKGQMQIDVAVEEIFVNISRYAYIEEPGKVIIRGNVAAEPPHTVTLAFEDEGKAFNPLERKPPDLTPAVRRHKVGGLGIFLVRSMSDDISYERREGKNILTIKKNLL